MIMIKISELKSNRKLLYKECRELRKRIKGLIENAKSSSGMTREKFLSQVETANEQLNASIEKIKLITEEIDSRKVNKRQKVKKSSKIHNISGRHIDPTCFSGVVQGGIPGAGKRR